VRQLSGEVRRMLPPQKRGLLTPAETGRAGASEADAADGPDAGWFGDDDAAGRG
jgi:hypothetical protein